MRGQILERERRSAHSIAVQSGRTLSDVTSTALEAPSGSVAQRHSGHAVKFSSQGPHSTCSDYLERVRPIVEVEGEQEHKPQRHGEPLAIYLRPV